MIRTTPTLLSGCTSTESYKSAPGNLHEVAKQLGVGNVLEGSVQKVADQVRVNVQLINAATQAHLWVESYDRKLTDIFTKSRSPTRWCRGCSSRSRVRFSVFRNPKLGGGFVVLLLIVGFPVALILAWAFELTPEGIKRTESADELPKKTSRNRAWLYVVIIAGAISASLFFFGRYTATSKQNGLTEVPAKSIAVLPFENLSGNPENADFTMESRKRSTLRLKSLRPRKWSRC